MSPQAYTSPPGSPISKLLTYIETRGQTSHRKIRYCLIGFHLVCFLLNSFGLLTTFHYAAGKSQIYEDNCYSKDDKHKLDTVGKSVLITGAAGFIGMHTAIELKKRGFRVVGIDNLNTYYSPQLKDDRVALLRDAQVEFIKGDVCDEELLVKTITDHNIDRVIHLAAQAGVRFSIESPHSYTKNNVDCFVSVLETFVKTGLHTKPIVYASSSSVYGFNKFPPSSEATSDVDHPASLYAATKRSDELIAHTYNHLYNVTSVGLRFFTVYGPYGRPDMSPMIFADKINQGATLKMFNFGESIRDFTYVSDIVNGVIASLEFKTEKPEIFNLGGNNPVVMTRFVELMEKGLGKNADKDFVPMQKGDVPMTYADVSKAKCLLGWSPVVPIENGMKLFLEWFDAHNASHYM